MLEQLDLADEGKTIVGNFGNNILNDTA